MVLKTSESPALAGLSDSLGQDPAIQADVTLDITRDICPMTFVRTRLALDRMASGQVLLVLLRGDEPRRNVPDTARALGHTVLGRAEDAGDVLRVWLRRA